MSSRCRSIKKKTILHNLENIFLLYRIGFCGEASPRFILPTEVESIADILKNSDTTLYDQTAAFLTKIFFK